MHSFDKRNWLNKTKNRNLSLIARKENFSAINDLTLLVDWCERKNIELTFNSDTNGVFWPSDLLIEINYNMLPVNQVIWLLHECGHYLIYRNGSKRINTFNKWYAERPNGHIDEVAYLDEEIDAWHRGKNLAKRLGINYDVHRFNRIRATSITSYR